jgi:signal transduction histidine kinase
MMKSATKERLFLWVAVPALAAVLIALAVLQYRWSGQVSAATKAQMESNLQVSLLGFRQDFTRELGAVCLEVKSAADESGSVNPAKMIQQFRHWEQTASHPGLVAHIYFQQNSRHNQLLRLDPNLDQVATVPWPSEFEQLRQRLGEISSLSNQPVAIAMLQRRRRAAGQPGGRTGDVFIPWAVDQSIPAVAYPLRQRDGDRKGDKVHPAVITWIIIQFNPSVIEKEVFPELAQKYFTGRAGLDYHVAVLEGGSSRQHLMYSSGAGFGENNDLPMDASMNLFGPLFRRGGPTGPGPELFVASPRPLPNERPAQSSDDRRDDRRNAGFDRLVRFEPFHYSSDQGVWEVVVKHQRGSVEAVVNSLRRRNLMVSFGVLVLLAVTMALIVIGAQRASRLARMQLDFVAGVSHEVRTPLAAISSAAENIAHGVVKDEQQLVRYGNSILKQSRQLTHLVEQVLLFAATQQSTRHYEVRPVDVGEVIDAVLESTSGIVAAARVSVERQIEPGLPPVNADFGALAQCLQNLITNAVKYGGNSRWLRVRASARKEKGIAREIEVSVEDKGIGISKKDIRHIFEPFYRSPAVTESQIHGTGLGLPLTRTLVEAIGGQLAAQSELGKGSSFTIRLSCADVAAEGLRLRLEDRAAAVDKASGAAPDYSS